MKILHLVHQFPPETRGGLEGYVNDLARSQQDAGDEVFILAGTLEAHDGADGQPLRESRSTYEGIEVLRFHRSDLYFDAWDKGVCPAVEAAFRRHLRSLRPDVVHIHHWIRLTPNLCAIARDEGFPVAVTIHDLATSCPQAFRMYQGRAEACQRALAPENCGHCAHRWPWHDDESMATALTYFRKNSLSELRGANAVFCASQSIASIVADGLGADDFPFVIAPLGHRQRFGSHKDRCPPHEPVTFGFWGSVTDRKGVLELIRAFRGARDEVGAKAETARLKIFGRIDREELRQAIETEAEGLPCTFHGPYEYADVESAELSVAVFPSLCIETWGLVVEEARELGLPMIVPDQGAMAERLDGAGLTYPMGDTQALGGCLRSFMDRPELVTELASHSTPCLRTPEDHRDEIQSVYQRIIGEGPRPFESDRSLGPLEHSAYSVARAELLFRRLLS